MGLEVGVVVAVAILVLLPLAAVWAAGRWRDPPPERWGVSERQLAQAAGDPELARHRRRVELGLAGDREWTAARRAVAHGTAARPELRAAVRVLATEQIARIDSFLARPRRAVLLQWLAFAAGTVGSLVLWLAWDNPTGLIVALYSVVMAALSSPWMVRRRRARAQAAVAANS